VCVIQRSVRFTSPTTALLKHCRPAGLLFTYLLPPNRTPPAPKGRSNPKKMHPPPPHPSLIHTRILQVNFPAAGESIMEGGLEAFEKTVGDYVEADETVRT